MDDSYPLSIFLKRPCDLNTAQVLSVAQLKTSDLFSIMQKSNFNSMGARGVSVVDVLPSVLYSLLVHPAECFRNRV